MRRARMPRLLAAAPLLVATAQPAWFTPPSPRPGTIPMAGPTPVVTTTLEGGTERITVLGHRAPIQRDPDQAAPLEPLRTYEAGASWGSTHPGQFCCASQYETGLDGQAGR